MAKSSKKLFPKKSYWNFEIKIFKLFIYESGVMERSDKFFGNNCINGKLNMYFKAILSGPENGNFPLLYTVKMSLRRWFKKRLKTPLRNIKMAP